MTGNIERVEVITSVQRRRRWSAEEKARIVQETYAPGMSVSLVARQHGVAPNQVFTWRRLYAEGALSAIGAGEEVVAASEYRALQPGSPTAAAARQEDPRDRDPARGGVLRIRWAQNVHDALAGNPMLLAIVDPCSRCWCCRRSTPCRTFHAARLVRQNVDTSFVVSIVAPGLPFQVLSTWIVLPIDVRCNSV